MESNSYCEQMKPFLQEKNIKIILFMKQKKKKILLHFDSILKSAGQSLYGLIIPNAQCFITL